MITGKTISLTRWTFVGKVMSLHFNRLSRLVITFLPRSKHLLISWLQSPSAVILEPPKIKSATVSTVSPSICHEVMGPDAIIFAFWMLNSDNHYIYYCGQEPFRRNGVAITINKRVQNAVLGFSLKNEGMISVSFQGKPFNITVIQVYALISNAEEAEVVWFYEYLQVLPELTPKKMSSSLYGTGM